MSILSTVTEFSLRGALVVGLLLILPVFNWPDIDFALVYIDIAVGYAKTFQNVMPVTYIFVLFSLSISFEIAMVVFKIVSKIISFIFAHKSPTEE